MARKSTVSVLLVLLIGIAVLGVWLVRSHGDSTTERSTKSPATQTTAPETDRDSKEFSRRGGARKRTPATRQSHPDQPSRDLEVLKELASELNITEAERKQVNTLIAQIETDRRQLFDALSRRESTVEEITGEMGALRTQLNQDIRDLLGDERTAALLDALRQKNQ